MSKYIALLNVLKANGLFRAIHRGNRNLTPPKGMTPEDVEARQRKVFESYLGMKMLSDPLLKSLMNKAAQELLFNALWNDFKGYEPKPEAPKEQSCNPKQNPFGDLTPEQALLMGILGGVLHSVFTESPETPDE